MVSERTVIRMLLNCHNLNTIVSVFLDSWQYILTELIVCAHLFGILSHSDMALVYKQRRLVGLELCLLPFIRFGIPNLCREYLCLLILNHTSSPSRDTFTHSTVPIYMHLEQIAMLDSFLREFQLPIASLVNTLSAITLALGPAIEVAYQINCSSVRSPFTEHPSTLCLVQAIVFMSVSKIRKFCLSIISQRVEFPQSMVVTSLDSLFVRLKISIIFNQSNMFNFGLGVFSLCLF